MRITVWLMALAFMVFCADAYCAPAGGVPRAVWQDSDRDNRRSPPQIKNQLKTKSPKVAPLADEAQRERAAKARNMIATGAAPLGADAAGMLTDGDWRLKILPAAVTNGENVTLGEIAIPLGEIDETVWAELRGHPLWAAPPEEGKPLQINRSRLSQALREALGKDYASRCVLPTSLVIQKGGVVFREDDLRKYVINSLAPQLSAMPGEAELTEFKLPEYIFLAHGAQQIQLEPGKLSPGRVPLRFAVKEADGNVLRRVSGTAKLSLWVNAPAAARPINKGDELMPDSITFMRLNAAQMKDVPWDGQGGPWRAIRSIGKGEPILQSDLANKMTVRRGSILTLNYERGNVRMTIQAEALADGEPGATIPVRNLQTKKQIYATVKDGGTVVIY